MKIALICIPLTIYWMNSPNSFPHEFPLVSIIIFIIAILTIIKNTIESSILFYGVADIIHHFSFWEMKDGFSYNKGKNPMGELLILNCLFVILNVFGIAMIFSFGYLLSFYIFILTPINPSLNYSINIQTVYRKCLKLIQFIFIFQIIFNIFSSINNQEFMYHYLSQIILQIVFYITWDGLLSGKNKLKMTLNVKTHLEKVSSRLKIPYFQFILCMALFPPISVSVQLLCSFFEYGYITYSQLNIFAGSFYISMACISLFFGIYAFKESTLEMSKDLVPYLKKQKYVESIFHLWECFSGPQILLFALAIALSAANLSFSYDFESLLLPNTLRIPFIFILFVIGLGIGYTIWILIFGPHFNWHVLSLLDVSKEKAKELATHHEFKKQSRIFGLLIGFGFYNFFSFLSLFFQRPLILLLYQIIPYSIWGFLMYYIMKWSNKKGIESIKPH